MLQIDLWKRVLIGVLCATGLLLALPNAFYTRVELHNDADRGDRVVRREPGTGRKRRRSGPTWLPSGLVNLGLDLRGGAHLLAEVQVEDVYAARMQGMWPEDPRRAARRARHRRHHPPAAIRPMTNCASASAIPTAWPARLKSFAVWPGRSRR